MRGGDFTALAALSDFFLSLGGAAVLSFVYQIAFSSAPRSKLLNCAAHAAFFAPAGLFAFCFVAGATAARSPRWYILAGAAVGAAAYIKCFSRSVARALVRVKKLLRKLFAPIAALALRSGRVLQKPLIKVYNRTAEARARRAKRREAENVVDGEGASTKKQPFRAYTQT